jgi:outer membrane protein assembly factor BamA
MGPKRCFHPDHHRLHRPLLRVKWLQGRLRADLGFTDRGDSRVQFGIGEKF